MTMPLPTTTAPPPVQGAAPVEVPPPINLRLIKMVTNRLDALPGRPRSPGFHPSELHKMCPVYHYFVEDARSKLAVEPAKSLAFLRACFDARKPGKLMLEFELGDQIHAQVQFHLGVSGVLWGLWMCPNCEYIVGPGFMPRVTIKGQAGQPVFDGAPCMRCNGRNRRNKWSWSYLEPKAESKEWGVKGRCDGLLVVTRTIKEGKGKNEVEKTIHYRCALEIKSINEYGWGEGKRKPWEDVAIQEGWTPPGGWTPEPPSKPLPQEDHVTQASTYAWLLELPHLYFIYVNKNKASTWKEVMVPMDRGVIGVAVQKMTAANQGKAQGRPPLEARICPDIREDTARECPAVEPCWGCKPAANFWDTDKEVFRAP